MAYGSLFYCSRRTFLSTLEQSPTEYEFLDLKRE